MVGVLQILAGLALFLFGIRLLSGGMEKLTGDRIQKWLDHVMNGRLKSAAFGAAATAMIQSSGLLMVTMMGLINANLMTVEQSIGVMLGQEIGTTLTAQIVAFEIGNYRLILVILGIALLEFFPNRDVRKYGEILMGLGIIFVGMGLMSQALDTLIEIPWVAQALVMMGQNPLIGVLAGLVMTSITQSSTAVTSLVVAMGMSQVITLSGAVGIILGANIGSCITGLVASISLSRAARHASLAQILINLFGVILFIPFIAQFVDVIQLTSTELPRQIANAHSLFNVTVSVILFPFVKQISQVAGWMLPKEETSETPRATAFIDENQYSVPAVALNEAARELTRVGEVTVEMVSESWQALLSLETEHADRVFELENRLVDPVCRELEKFINFLMREELSEQQQKRCFQLKGVLVDVERVGDMAEDIAQFALERKANNLPFTQEAVDELDCLFKQANETYALAVQAFATGDRNQARLVCEREEEFDHQYWRYRHTHIERLQSGCCDPGAAVIYTETLRLLERVSDHADNLGISVLRS